MMNTLNVTTATCISPAIGASTSTSPLSSMPQPIRAVPAPAQKRRVLIVANGLFGSQLAGGDIHLLHSIKAFVDAGWEVTCFSGKVLESHLRIWHLPVHVISTEGAAPKHLNDSSLLDKVRLFCEFLRRCVSTFWHLRFVQHNDAIFCPTDAWFDVLPVVFSKARLKVVMLQMEAPSLRQVLLRSRADVDAGRIASLHYCLSQWASLTALRFCKRKRIISVQPMLQCMLRNRGFTAEETPLVPNGVDVATARSAGHTRKRFDVVWMGRLHRQKGVDDLLKTLVFLAREVQGFRALLIGNFQDTLGPRISALGLAGHVHFTGFVSGVDKFAWLKQARVFLMPSKHEGLPIVIGEALASDLVVVAYELEMYRPFYGSLLRYVRPFDLDEFCKSAQEAVVRTRAGDALTNKNDLDIFLKAHDWSTVESCLAQVLTPLTAESTHELSDPS